MPTTINGETYTAAKLAITEDVLIALSAHFAADGHGHFIAHIQGLADALAAKQASLGYTPLNSLSLGQPDGAAKLGPDGKLLATHVPAGLGAGTGGGGNAIFVKQDEATGKYLALNPETGLMEEIYPGGENDSVHLIGYTDPRTVAAFAGKIKEFLDWWYPLVPPPGNFSVTNRQDTSFNLTWSAVANATRYKVLVLDKLTGQPVAGYNLLPVEQTSASVTGLTANTEYLCYVLAEFDAEGGQTSRTYKTIALLAETVTFTLDSFLLSLNPEHYWLLNDAGAAVEETELLDSSNHPNAANGTYVANVTFGSDALASNYPGVKSAYFNPSGLAGGGLVDLANGKEIAVLDKFCLIFAAKKTLGAADRNLVQFSGAVSNTLLKLRSNATDPSLIDVYWRGDAGNTVINTSLVSTPVYASTSVEVVTTMALFTTPPASGLTGKMDVILLINAGLPSEQRIVAADVTPRLTTINRVTFANNSSTTAMSTTLGNKVKLSRVGLLHGANTPTEATIRDVLAKGIWE